MRERSPSRIVALVGAGVLVLALVWLVAPFGSLAAADPGSLLPEEYQVEAVLDEPVTVVDRDASVLTLSIETDYDLAYVWFEARAYPSVNMARIAYGFRWFRNPLADDVYSPIAAPPTLLDGRLTPDDSELRCISGNGLGGCAVMVFWGRYGQFVFRLSVNGAFNDVPPDQFADLTAMWDNRISAALEG